MSSKATVPTVTNFILKNIFTKIRKLK